MINSIDLSIRFKKIERTEFIEGLILPILTLSGAVSFLVYYILTILGISNNSFTVFSLLGLLFLLITIIWFKFRRKVVYF